MESNTNLLNQEQKVVFQKITKKFMKYNFKPDIISGHAGTGKTFLSTSIVEHALEQGLESIYLTSPTNQATKNLKSVSTKNVINDSRTVFKTLHSFFGLTQFVDGHGKITYKPASENKFAIRNRHKKTQLLIIDEASMIDKYIFSYIKSFQLDFPNVPIVFIGDPYQIPPINEKESIVFSQNSFDKHVLENIVRQKETHPVIPFADIIRKNISSSKDFLPQEPKQTENSIGKVELFNDKEKFVNLLEYYFKNATSHSNYYCKVIAWRNATLDYLNQLIRQIVFDSENLDKIVEQEKLLIDSPVTHNKQTVLHVNDEVVVKKLKKDSIQNSILGRTVNLKYYLVNVEYVHFGLRFNHDIKILHEDSENEFSEILKKLKSKALSKQQGTKEAKLEWVRYYDFYNKFTRIKYSYCITAHKSQGSTYENVIIMNDDINANPKSLERNKLKYTSITRTSKNLHIFLNN